MRKAGYVCSGIVKTTELGEATGMVNRARLMKLKIGNDYQMEKKSINFTNTMSANHYSFSRRRYSTMHILFQVDSFAGLPPYIHLTAC